MARFNYKSEVFKSYEIVTVFFNYNATFLKAGTHVHNGGWKTLGRAHTINSTPCFVSLKES